MSTGFVQSQDDARKSDVGQRGTNHQPLSREGSGDPIAVEGEASTLLTSNRDEDASHNNRGCLGKMKYGARRFVSNVDLSVEYTKTDVRRRPRNCLLGFLAVFLVVFFVGLVLAAISKTSYVLLRFAELNGGEMDAIIYATNGVPFVNYTDLSSKIDANATHIISGSSPRWIARGRSRRWRDVLPLRSITNRTVADALYDNLTALPMNILVADTAREKAAGIGRAWPYRKIGYGEAQATYSALEFLGVAPNVGDRLELSLELSQLLSDQGASLPTTTTIPGTSLNFTPTQASALQDFLASLNISANITGGNASSTDLTVNLAALLANPRLDFTMADAIFDTDGKYPSLYGNVLLLDYEYLLQMVVDQQCLAGGTVFQTSSIDGQNVIQGNNSAIAQQVLTSLSAPGAAIAQILSSTQLEEYALLVVAMFRNRFTMYYKNNLDMNHDMVRNSDALMLALDYRYPGEVQYPLALIMRGFTFLSSLLTSIFATIVVIIIVLCTILVVSLLQQNGEERQFEFAMVRSQGMSTDQLITLMLTQVLVFTIPGIVVGLGLLFAANAIFEYVLSDFTAAPAELTRIPAWSTVFAALVGLLLPLIANAQPLSEAMSTSLRDALDVARQRWNETSVTMVKLAELGLEVWQLCFGLFLVIAGFMVYYLMPMSFIFNNITLFFTTLNIILLVMLFGFCLLAFTVQGQVQNLLLWLALWGKEKRLLTFIKKSMQSHRDQNAKAYMMFLICVACVVFGGLAFNMLSNSMVEILRMSSGADVVITSLNFNDPLNQTALDTILNDFAQRGYCVNWSFATYPLASYPQVSGRTSVVNILGLSTNLAVVGMTQSYLNTAFEKFVSMGPSSPGIPIGTSATGAKDVISSLYTHPRSNIEGEAKVFYTGYPPNRTAPDALAKVEAVVPTVMAVAADKVLGINPSALFVIRYSYRLANGGTQTTDFLAQPRALMNRFPGFPAISSQRLGFAAGSVLVSVNSFQTLITPNNTDFEGIAPAPDTMLRSTAVTEVRYQKVFIRVSPGLSDSQRLFFVNSLQAYVDAYSTNTVDIEAVAKSLTAVGNLMMAFYYFAASVCVLLSTFMTWLVFISNVNNHAWTFGVLRSLGFTKGQVLRVTLYEAIVLVMSAFLVGVPIGLFVGFTLEFQMNVFLNLPLAFLVPWQIMIALFGISFFGAIVGSAVPIRTLNSMPISVVLKKF